MSQKSNKTIQYSPDGGNTWMGPFSRAEIEQLKQAGIIEPSYIIRDQAAPAASPGVPAAEAVEEIGGETTPPPMGNSTPPPADDSGKTYYINLAGAQKGPFTLNELRQLVNTHTLTPATMCWSQGMPGWQMAKDVLPELFTAGQEEKLGKLEGFSLGSFFADVFKRHNPQEMVDLFCCGSSKTTPPLSEVKTGWPSPWIFARMLALCLVLYFGFNWALGEYANQNLIPGLIFVGNFGIPLCVVVLFFELNVRRDVPFTKVVIAMVLGGLISLIVSLFLYRNIRLGEEAYWAGPIEETGKLLTVILIASTLHNGRILTGMLLGCAVGAGFAAFESAGYTFGHLSNLIMKNSIVGFLQGCNQHELARRVTEIVPNSNPDFVMQMRALLTPFGHVVWTAITAGAFWFVQKLKIEAMQRPEQDRSIDFSILWDMRFLRIALIPVGLHMLWNSNLLPDFGFWKHIAIGVVGWIVALRLVQAGLKQVKKDQLKQNN